MFFWLRNNILLIVNYPKDSDCADGYFQRVLAIDDSLYRMCRIYVDYTGNNWIPYIRNLKDGVYELKTSKRNIIGLSMVIGLVFFSNQIYFHSILRLRSRFHRFIFLLSRRRIIDLHGAVPEELDFQGKNKEALIFEDVERRVVRRADILISVSDALIQHIKKKHALSNEKFIMLPIFSRLHRKSSEKCFSKNVIYCGGLQKWQQVEKMLEYVYIHRNECQFTFLVPTPESLEKRYFDLYGEVFPGLVKSADSNEVNNCYEKNNFGLVLREDIVVNRVACPTKLIEYLQNDIVPIVDCESIGDFNELGYKFVSYKDVLPEESGWGRMIEGNQIVLERLQKISDRGKEELAEKIIDK